MQIAVSMSVHDAAHVDNQIRVDLCLASFKSSDCFIVEPEARFC
jgi:hypothetical protein